MKMLIPSLLAISLVFGLSAAYADGIPTPAERGDRAKQQHIEKKRTLAPETVTLREWKSAYHAKAQAVRAARAETATQTCHAQCEQMPQGEAAQAAKDACREKCETLKGERKPCPMPAKGKMLQGACEKPPAETPQQ